MNRLRRLVEAFLASGSLRARGVGASIVAAEFAILPLRVELDRANRAAEVVVRNDDKAPLRMQVQAMAWRQDADGKDQYEPAEGLIYFPRALEIRTR